MCWNPLRKPEVEQNTKQIAKQSDKEVVALANKIIMACHKEPHVRVVLAMDIAYRNLFAQTMLVSGNDALDHNRKQFLTLLEDLAKFITLFDVKVFAERLMMIRAIDSDVKGP